MQYPLTVTPELTEATTPELYVYWMAKLEDDPEAKFKRRLLRVTESEVMSRPGDWIVKFVPERVHVRLELTHVVFDCVVISEGSAI